MTVIPRVSKEVEPYRSTPWQLHCVKIMTQWQDPITRSLGQRDPQRKPLSPICDLPIPPLFSPSLFICQPPPPPLTPYLPFFTLVCPFFSPLYFLYCLPLCFPRRRQLSPVPPFSSWQMSPSLRFPQLVAFCFTTTPRAVPMLYCHDQHCCSLSSPLGSLSAAGQLGESTVPSLRQALLWV